MKTFKFINKISKVVVCFGIITGILGILLFIKVDIAINKMYLFFFFSLLTYLVFKLFSKKGKITIVKIMIEQSFIQVNFVVNTYEALKIDRDNVDISALENEIIFKNKTGKIIGMAYKDKMEEPEKWNELISALSLPA